MEGHSNPPLAPGQRTLAAIVFTDVAGSTRRMAEDEVATLSLVRRDQAVLEAAFANRGGRVVKRLGDGLLVVFSSTVEAVLACLEAQESLASLPDALPHRIGVHVGDVLLHDSDAFGDGVNVASRIQGEAEPGEVVASDAVVQMVRGKAAVTFSDRGRRTLRGLHKPVSVFQVRREGSRAPLRVRRRLRVTLLGVGALLLGLAVGIAFRLEPGPRDIPAVAVLPFADLSPDDPGTEALADGLHEDVINTLARLRGIQVISRTSVARYRPEARDLEPAAIAQQLGVNAVLEGGVRRQGNRMRLTVQLFDTQTQRPIWAEVFERRVDDLLDVQASLAREVAEALQARLTPDELGALAARDGSGPAYETLLRARQAARAAAGDPSAATALYEEAIRLEPGYALAHAELAQLHLRSYWFAEDRRPERLALALAAAETARRLDPQLPQTQLALGTYQLYGRRDFVAALAHFERAVNAMPNSAEGLAALAAVQRRMGRWQDAAANFARASRLDPLQVVYTYNSGDTLRRLRDLRGARSAVLDGLARDPQNPALLKLRADLALDESGLLGPMREYLDVLSSNEGVTPDLILLEAVTLDLYEGNAARARERLDASDVERIDGQLLLWPRELLLAHIARAAGDRATARAASQAALERLQSALLQNADDPRLHAACALALAGAGDPAGARAAADRAVQIAVAAGDAFDALFYRQNRAAALAWAGDASGAVAELSALLAEPSDITPHRLRLDPLWIDLRDTPAFQALIAGRAL